MAHPHYGGLTYRKSHPSPPRVERFDRHSSRDTSRSRSSRPSFQQVEQLTSHDRQSQPTGQSKTSQWRMRNPEKAREQRERELRANKEQRRVNREDYRRYEEELRAHRREARDHTTTGYEEPEQQANHHSKRPRARREVYGVDERRYPETAGLLKVWSAEAKVERQSLRRREFERHALYPGDLPKGLDGSGKRYRSTAEYLQKWENEEIEREMQRRRRH